MLANCIVITMCTVVIMEITDIIINTNNNSTKRQDYNTKLLLLYTHYIHIYVCIIYNLTANHHFALNTYAQNYVSTWNK